jgi:RNA-directed DNA polymerase
MENYIRDSFPNFYMGNQKWKPHLIRYADDFIIIHKDLDVIKKSQTLIQNWLSEIRLELKPAKTSISHTLNKYDGKGGFDFLGFTIRQYPVGKTHSGKLHRPGKKSTLLGFKTIITPSKISQSKHSKTIRDKILKLKNSSQLVLIAQLNPIIRGWCNYFSKVCSAEIFSNMKNMMYQKLLKWAKRRHPNKSAKWTVNKYWRIKETGKWIFATKQGIKLLYHSRVHINRHIKIKGNKSPFDGDAKYWSIRNSK